jgi:hypothetical protein
MVNLLINEDTLGEKLFIFIEFKKGIPSDLGSQNERKRLNDKH